MLDIVVEEFPGLITYVGRNRGLYACECCWMILNFGFGEARGSRKVVEMVDFGMSWCWL